MCSYFPSNNAHVSVHREELNTHPVKNNELMNIMMHEANPSTNVGTSYCQTKRQNEFVIITLLAIRCSSNTNNSPTTVRSSLYPCNKTTSSWLTLSLRRRWGSEIGRGECVTGSTQPFMGAVCYAQHPFNEFQTHYPDLNTPPEGNI